MAALRGRGIACCFDASPDNEHATLAVAVRLPDGRVRVELAGAWTSQQAARAELGPLLDRIRPQVTGWYPGSPSAAFASILRQRPGCTEIAGSRVGEACMELASLVTARRILHGGEEILDQHVSGATRLATSDGWRFGRKGEAACDAGLRRGGSRLLRAGAAGAHAGRGYGSSASPSGACP